MALPDVGIGWTQFCKIEQDFQALWVPALRCTAKRRCTASGTRTLGSARRFPYLLRHADLRLKEASMAKGKKRKSPRSPAELSTLDHFLKEDGKLGEFQATAIKEVLAWQGSTDDRTVAAAGTGIRLKPSA